MGTPNWSNLFRQGRCKAVGVPWTEEEAKAVYELKVPVSYVRRGCLTPEDAEKLKQEDLAVEKKTGEKPLVALTRDELLAKAKDLGIQITSDVNEETLVSVISKVPKKIEPKVKKKTGKHK